MILVCTLCHFAGTDIQQKCELFFMKYICAPNLIQPKLSMDDDVLRTTSSCAFRSILENVEHALFIGIEIKTENGM